MDLWAVSALLVLCTLSAGYVYGVKRGKLTMEDEIIGGVLLIVALLMAMPLLVFMMFD